MVGEKNNFTEESTSMSFSEKDLSTILPFESTVTLGQFSQNNKDYSGYDIVDYSIDRAVWTSDQLPTRWLITLLVRPSEGKKGPTELLLVEHVRETPVRTRILESLTQVQLVHAQDLQSHALYFAADLNVCLQVLSFDADATFRLRKPVSERDLLDLYIQKLDHDWHLMDPAERIDFNRLRVIVLVAHLVLPRELAAKLEEEEQKAKQTNPNCEIMSTLPWPHMLAFPIPMASASVGTTIAELLPSSKSSNYFTVCLKGSTSIIQFKVENLHEVFDICTDVFDHNDEDDKFRKAKPEDRIPFPKIVFLNSKCDVKYAIRDVFSYPNTASKDEKDQELAMPEQKHLNDICIVSPEMMRYHVSYKLQTKEVDWGNLDRLVPQFQELPVQPPPTQQPTGSQSDSTLSETTMNTSQRSG